MDAERGRVVRRSERRAGKLTVVVAVQSALVAACLLVTLYVYWLVQDQEQERVSGDNVHIQFGPISSFSGNATLQFNHTYSMNMMGLAGGKNQEILVNCTGPYVLYVDVCYLSLTEEEITGTLQLQVAGSGTPVSSFTLQASREVCRGLHSLAYLRAKEQASLHLVAREEFKIKRATVGLSYLLGTASQCYYTH